MGACYAAFHNARPKKQSFITISSTRGRYRSALESMVQPTSQELKERAFPSAKGEVISLPIHVADWRGISSKSIHCQLSLLLHHRLPL